MAISPWYAGQTRPVWQVNWPTANLVAATLSVFFAKEGGATTTGAGTFALTAPFYGQFTYSPDATDLSAAGTYAIQFMASFPDTTTQYSDPFNVIVITPE